MLHTSASPPIAARYCCLRCAHRIYNAWNLFCNTGTVFSVTCILFTMRKSKLASTFEKTPDLCTSCFYGPSTLSRESRLTSRSNENFSYPPTLATFSILEGKKTRGVLAFDYYGRRNNCCDKLIAMRIAHLHIIITYAYIKYTYFLLKYDASALYLRNVGEL